MTHAIETGPPLQLEPAVIYIAAKDKAGSTERESTSPVRGQTLDGASLSGAGNLLSIAAAASGGDDVRADKVSALRAAIEDGSYNVPASAVADGIIRNLVG